MANIKQEHTIILDNGTIAPCQEPVVVSASRSTDIPAFYCDWFFHRLKVGYSAWTNPFNGVKMYVSYAKTRFIVFWSKNPRPLLEHLDELKERGINCYIQYSLNDYEDEKLEKGVRPLAERIETFKLLVEQLGLGSVIWRFDPLMLTDDIDIDKLLKKIENIGDQLKGYTEKLVFSFADIALYRKVKSNLEINGIPYHEWTTEQMEEFADKLSIMNRERGWTYLLKIKVEDIPAPSLFGESELPNGAIQLPNNHYFISKHKKGAGQRQYCQCMTAKDIGEYNTCPHLCEYCYANTSKEIAIANWKKHQNNPYAETITDK